jgi:GTPase SAR1 family protein
LRKLKRYLLQEKQQPCKYYELLILTLVECFGTQPVPFALLAITLNLGQEEFDAVTRTYYRGAGAAVLAFSTTDRDSFEAVESWKNKVEAECGKIAMVLIQNKIDLIEKAVLTRSPYLSSSLISTAKKQKVWQRSWALSSTEHL